MPKLLEEASENVKRITAIVAGATAISGLVVAITGWDPAKVTLVTSLAGIILIVFGMMCDRIVNRVDTRIDAVEKKMGDRMDTLQNQNREQDLSLKRLELLNLIRNAPDNKVEIERVAKHYFVTLQGDWYMTKMYSEWASQHDGDISFVISE